LYIAPTHHQTQSQNFFSLNLKVLFYHNALRVKSLNSTPAFPVAQAAAEQQKKAVSSYE
jgi:hypothetical protein